jgi:peptide subunit release factor 1 (eRF1)
MDLLRTRAFDRLLLAGPDEALVVLERTLTRPSHARFAGRVELEMFARDADVMAHLLHAEETIERQAEQQLVDELRNDADTSHTVLGVAGTLDALAEGRVHLLVVADDFDEAGARCLQCRRLVRDHGACPACGAATVAVAQLREPLVRQALAQDARIEIVSGAAAARLHEQGGIGAWTRF